MPGLFPTTDWLIDLVNFSFLIIVPTLLYSWRKVRRGEYALHKKVQVILFVILFIATILFELDLRMRGGIFKMVETSRFAGTRFLNSLIYFHTLTALTTSLIWIVLVALSLWKFANPPKPNTFSRAHIFWGRLGMIDMLLTGVTGVMLYVLGFALTK